jgi:hypothetical protein
VLIKSNGYDAARTPVLIIGPKEVLVERKEGIVD